MENGSRKLTLKHYILLGWYTVPLGGTLERLPDGSKTIPSFPAGWRETYTNERNVLDSALGGAITGKVSNIIAIDCDNEDTYSLFRSLDPDYPVVFESIGKTKKGKVIKAGTLIYRYDADLSFSFGIKNERLELDFYSDNGFIYLATEGNKTKVAPEILDVKEIPTASKSLLLTLKEFKEKRVADVREYVRPARGMHLNYLLRRFIDNKTFLPALFKIITPKDFRDTEQYLELGYLHPDKVPSGRGSEYLSKVSAILGSDESVDEALYVAAMNQINNMFSDPMKKARLNATIIDPMIEEKAEVNGVPLWQYNENWEANSVVFTDKRGNRLEAFFDSERAVYYLVDVLKEKVHQYERDAEIINYIETVSGASVSKRDFKASIPLITATSNPKYLFGYYETEENQCFNLFRPTAALAILHSPENYKKIYKTPELTLRYLETLVPDNATRHYLLRFIRKKLTSFEYSPVVIYLLGASGAGKDMLVTLLENFIGADCLARPSAKVFSETHNGWLLDKYFVQLDEYGNQLTSLSEKELVLGKLKSYTGNKNVQIRKMATDGFSYQHNITFIMTANSNPLIFDADDRRIFLVNTPNVLASCDWVQREGGASVVYTKVQEEINDFAYYLATEVDDLGSSEYCTAPMSANKKALLAGSYSPSQRMIYFINARMWDELADMCEEYSVASIMTENNRLYEDDLYALYYEVTEGKGSVRGLTTLMKQYKKCPTTRNGKKAYYYYFHDLRETHKPIEDDEEEIIEQSKEIDLGEL